jgi:hypothetical protein
MLIYLNIHTIHRNYDVLKSFGGDKGICFSRFARGMPQSFLYQLKLSALRHMVHGKSIPEQMWGNLAFYVSFFYKSFFCLCYARSGVFPFVLFLDVVFALPGTIRIIIYVLYKFLIGFIARYLLLLFLAKINFLSIVTAFFFKLQTSSQRKPQLSISFKMI